MRTVSTLSALRYASFASRDGSVLEYMVDVVEEVAKAVVAQGSVEAREEGYIKGRADYPRWLRKKLLRQGEAGDGWMFAAGNEAHL